MSVNFVIYRFATPSSPEKSIAFHVKDIICPKDKVAASKTDDFAFADINCRLGLKAKDGAFIFFNDEHELENILE